MSDDDNDGRRRRAMMAVELFGQNLRASLRGDLRLIVLEACEGARPGAAAPGP